MCKSPFWKELVACYNFFIYTIFRMFDYCKANDAVIGHPVVEEPIPNRLEDPQPDGFDNTGFDVIQPVNLARRGEVNYHQNLRFYIFCSRNNRTSIDRKAMLKLFEKMMKKRSTHRMKAMGIFRTLIPISMTKRNRYNDLDLT